METNRLIQILVDQKEELRLTDVAALCTRLEEKQVDLDSHLAQVVIGVRRSGKSTLCQKVLLESGRHFAYVNFDDDRLLTFTVDDFDTLLDALYQVYGDFSHLLLDEVQNVKGWQLFCNRMLRQKVHLIITGSNANLLSKELTTHLTGRYAKIELYPFSFQEYCQSNDIDLRSLTTKGKALRKKALLDYLQEGGFPELLHERNKRGYVESLLNTILSVDITKRFRLKNPETLRKMATYLADTYCQEFSAKAVGKLFGISDHTADTYYAHLKEAFLCIGLSKFSFKSRERVRSEKVYLVDNVLSSEREQTFMGANLGWRLENAVFIELLRRTRPLYKDVFYARENGWEIDFVIADHGHVEELIQVATDVSAPKTLERELRALRNGARKFSCDKLLLLTLNDERTIEQDGLTIKIMPAAQWFLE